MRWPGLSKNNNNTAAPVRPTVLLGQGGVWTDDRYVPGTLGSATPFPASVGSAAHGPRCPEAGTGETVLGPISRQQAERRPPRGPGGRVGLHRFPPCSPTPVKAPCSVPTDPQFADGERAAGSVVTTEGLRRAGEGGAGAAQEWTAQQGQAAATEPRVHLQARNASYSHGPRRAIAEASEGRGPGRHSPGPGRQEAGARTEAMVSS